ncbi:hypothetical protein LQ327_22880 [Actinomycetospora endophytica]|uniref:Uncharacterized protein n=1 Tax=Actinomycetospora endophytica TaxID=2291215 RepID=A0ABS8PD65_9PSEU|nr:hypothetical protein [Actinomycetospora endophytica]MCD2196223.1 hypothetical protein [Actinomycetospora endophytica]
MTKTQPQSGVDSGATASPVGPWVSTQRGVHWGEVPSQSGGGPVPPAGLPPMGWQGYGAPTPQRRSGMRWGWIVLGVVLAIVAVAIIGTVAQKTSKMTINGSVTVYGMNGVVMPGSACENPSMRGKPVSIFGSNGDLVGTSSLTGSGTALDQWNTYSSGYADACQYSFTFTNVSGADDFYTVAVGTSAGQGVGFSKEQLQTSGAQVTYGHA